MQYIAINKNGSITAVADWCFEGSVPAEREVVYDVDGQLAYKDELDEAHENAVREARKQAEMDAKANAVAEAQRVPDLEDATIDLAAYVATLEKRIAALEMGKKE